MNIPTAICCKCLVAMRPAKNGVLVEMTALDGYGQPFSVYKISSDKLRCPNCGVEILAKFPTHPFAAHWQEKYEERSCDVQARFE